MLKSFNFVTVIVCCVVSFSSFAQDDIDGGSFENSAEDQPSFDDPALSDESDASSQPTPLVTPDLQSQGSTTNPANLFTSTSGGSESPAQNAIIEGVQLTAEPGALPDEKVIAGYFIFRDKPSSYFYEIKLREKKLIFEFNDTRVGASPVPTTAEAPIRGFVIEQGKIDVNKAVKGLKPEWHDLIRVIFDLDAVPDVHVNDEYSIISFSFKWSSDPQKQAKYTIKDQTPKVILWSTAGVGGIALGAVAYLFLRPPERPPVVGQLDATDLPEHKQP